jgi:hypothetical protein
MLGFLYLAALKYREEVLELNADWIKLLLGRVLFKFTLFKFSCFPNGFITGRAYLIRSIADNARGASL